MTGSRDRLRTLAGEGVSTHLTLLRQRSLARLPLPAQILQMLGGAKRRTFDELMAEIHDLKAGAFAPLSDQPFVGAVLFPGAGLRLLAVAQRLLGIF